MDFFTRNNDDANPNIWPSIQILVNEVEQETSVATVASAFWLSEAIADRETHIELGCKSF